jgi:hypothetical protein
MNLVAVALIALLGPARAAEDDCEKFAWCLAQCNRFHVSNNKSSDHDIPLHILRC